MPKILITDSCLVNNRDDKGGQHAEAYDIINVNKDTARDLINANRALYVNAEDDPTKTKIHTASAEMLEAAKAAKAAKAKAAKAEPPAGGKGGGTDPTTGGAPT